VKKPLKMTMKKMMMIVVQMLVHQSFFLNHHPLTK